MIIYMVRHIKTNSNKLGLIQGSIDNEIIQPNRKALDKVRIIKNYLDKINFDQILTSELKRTIQTANLYGFNEPNVEPLINEFNFGSYEGTLKRQLNVNPNWVKNPFKIIFGESSFSFEKRIDLFLNKYRSSPKILIFSHGMFSRGLLSKIEYGNLSRINFYKIKNNSLIEINTNNKIIRYHVR